MQNRKEIVIVDSRDRQPVVGTQVSHPGNYVISLPKSYERVSSIRLLSAEIPLTFHNISPELGNNVFRLTTSGTPYRVIELAPMTILTPEGLVNQLQYQFDIQKLGIQVGLYGGFVTFTSTEMFQLDFSEGYGVNAGSTEWGLGWTMGFYEKRVYNSLPVREREHEIMATHPISLFPMNYIQMNIEGRNGMDETLSGLMAGQTQTTFAKLIINPTFGTLMPLHEGMIPSIKEFNPVENRIDKLHITFHRHGDRRPINFNNVENSLTFEITHAPR